VTDCVVISKPNGRRAIPRFHPNSHALRSNGRRLAEAKVERAITLSAEKYCSATAIIGQTAKITHDWKVIEEDAPAGELQVRA